MVDWIVLASGLLGGFVAGVVTTVWLLLEVAEEHRYVQPEETPP